MTVTATNSNNTIVSPSSGRIEQIIVSSEITICIFLTIFDDHDQCYPINGWVVSHTRDDIGRYRIVWSGRKTDNNEKVIHVLHNWRGDTILVTQIAGLFYREISYLQKDRSFCQQGQFLGKISMGSRVDITFPASYTLYPDVKVGEKVDAFHTKLAYLGDG